MGELENPTFLEMLKKTDPVSLGIAAICLFIIVFLYRKQLYDVFETYVMGRIFKKKEEEEKNDDDDDSDKKSNDDVFTLLLSLQDEVQQMKETQKEISVNQDRLSDNIMNIQAELSITHDKMNRISESQEFLMASDKEDKKAFITREYNYFCGKVQKIDLYSKETIEKIYELYLKEGGDTFVAGMMSSIRSLQTIGQPTTGLPSETVEDH